MLVLDNNPNNIKYITPPMAHQREFVEWAINFPRVGLFDEPGSGKTKMALDIAQNRDLDAIIIFLPARLKDTWLNEIDKHYRGEIQPQFIGYEMLSTKTFNFNFNITDKTLLIFDESHLIKNPYSKRGKKLIKLFSKYTPQVISMTGTPKPQDNRDLFMQAGILDIPAGQISNRLFVGTYTKMVQRFGTMVWDEDINTDYLISQFKKVAVFRKKSDMLDLPEKIYSSLYYAPDPKLIQVFKELTKESVYLFENAETNSDKLSIAKRHIMNSIRLCSGYLTVEDEWENKELKQIIPFKDNPKIKLLLTLLETFMPMDKVIILTCFAYEAEEIGKVLREALKQEVLVHHGQSKISNLENTFNRGSAPYLVATIQSVDVGLTLTSCSKIVYYNNTYQTVQRLQSEDRIHRKGQNKDCNYYDLVAKGFPDEKVMLVVKKRIASSNALFDLYKQLIN